eukprot:3919505-Lingulodinium_polyedra.AAC.1
MCIRDRCYSLPLLQVAVAKGVLCKLLCEDELVEGGAAYEGTELETELVTDAIASRTLANRLVSSLQGADSAALLAPK